ncbi:flagellar biosynthesis protein FlhF [Solimonas terrae]|uniref:Flagellar biosynthesis protein FlhF n=1 Tax=Solimonas terrae TaxID=1396819 RepID=A0A6M2BXJ4_9GAMM|nr:flagellar biosynthesis protein FlhF [Solimonas terrae]NGY06901.1 flagellar biosynthesis protein FlhF [Solimonas terrae]
MKIKRFLAKNMRDAIRMVREEQGPDAVILSNHRVAGGVEVVAATDYDAALIQQATRRSAPPEPPPETPKPTRSEDSRPVATPAPIATPAAPELQQLRRELGGMKRMLETQMAGMAWREIREHPQKLHALQTMVNLGIEPRLAREIVAELPGTADAERARFLPLGLLSRRIPVASADPIQDGGVIALVGPTGVGKTTTIAKLAARYAEMHGTRDLALVTTDHFRVGAQEQLFTYGRLLGVPVQTAGNADELRTVLARLADRKLVLIDTAGIGPRDAKLQAQLGAMGSAGAALKSWLVLSANSHAADLDDVIRRYAKARPVACVITKLDETLRIGGALSAVIRHRLPVAYGCDGQQVPEDIEPGRANSLVLRAMQLARMTPARIDDATLALQFGAVHVAQ